MINIYTSYIIVDMNHKIIFSSSNIKDAEEKFNILQDKQPKTHIILAQIKKEFVRDEGKENYYCCE